MNCPVCSTFTSSKYSCTSCGAKLPQNREPGDEEPPRPNPVMPGMAPRRQEGVVRF